MNQEFVAPSGAKIVINVADWQDAKRLKKAIQKELAASGVSIDLKADISRLIAAVVSVDASDAVDAAFVPCLARCLRDGQKITDATFNDVKAREDYYEIIYRCAEANLAPLVRGLISLLPPEFMATLTKKSESAQQ